jgi:hypothetical protein
VDLLAGRQAAREQAAEHGGRQPAHPP